MPGATLATRGVRLFSGICLIKDERRLKGQSIRLRGGSNWICRAFRVIAGIS
jgi:hypothetical protein